MFSPAQLVQAGKLMKQIGPTILDTRRSLSETANTDTISAAIALSTPPFPAMLALSALSGIGLAAIAVLCLIAYPFLT